MLSAAATARYSVWARENESVGLHFLVLDMTPVGSVDAMALHFLEELVLSAYQVRTCWGGRPLTGCWC